MAIQNLRPLRWRSRGRKGGRRGGRRWRQPPRHQNKRRVLPATPTANAGSSRRARPHSVAAVGRAATVCPVGVWCGAPTSRPRSGRTSSCGPPDGSHTAWSFTTTGARTRSRRRQKDMPVVLVPWWLPSAPPPPPSPVLPPQSSPQRAQVLYRHIRLCVPLLLEGQILQM